MSNLIRVGKRLVPLEHVALVEPFVLAPDSPLRTNRDLHARIVLLDRAVILSESTPEDISAAHGFRLLPLDRVATNPAIRFGVEEFEPSEDFKPSKDFLSRLTWTDVDRAPYSKLLLTAPEVVLAIAVRGEEAPVPGQDNDDAPSAPKRRRRNAARAAAGAPKMAP
jgi:hypothetical protein